MRSTARAERGIVADVFGTVDEGFDVDLRLSMVFFMKGKD